MEDLTQTVSNLVGILLGIERVEVLSANDEAACEPCRRRDGGKFVIRASMPDPTAAVCESDWCRCAHLAVLDLA